MEMEDDPNLLANERQPKVLVIGRQPQFSLQREDGLICWQMEVYRQLGDNLNLNFLYPLPYMCAEKFPLVSMGG
jgi:hypothetical protein